MWMREFIRELLLLCPHKSQNMIEKNPTVIDVESGVCDQTWTDLSSVSIQDTDVKALRISFRYLASWLSWINPVLLCSHPNILAYDWWQTSLLATEQTVTLERHRDNKYTVEYWEVKDTAKRGGKQLQLPNTENNWSTDWEDAWNNDLLSSGELGCTYICACTVHSLTDLHLAQSLPWDSQRSAKSKWGKKAQVCAVQDWSKFQM